MDLDIVHQVGIRRRNVSTSPQQRREELEVLGGGRGEDGVGPHSLVEQHVCGAAQDFLERHLVD